MCVGNGRMFYFNNDGKLDIYFTNNKIPCYEKQFISSFC